MATKLQGNTNVTKAVAGFDAADLEQRVKQIPDIFAGLSSDQLLSQVPAIRSKAVAHKKGADAGAYLEQLKGVSRSYRRMVGELAGVDRLEPSMVLPMLQRLEGVFTAASAAGISRESLVGQSDKLTQQLVGAMAVVGLLL